MHKHSCAHRDLKPANVLLTWDSFGRITALVSDLGWARQMPPSCGGSGGAPEPVAKDTGGRGDCPTLPVLTPGCCTWPYRAPEVELGMPYSLSLDIWSMGIVFEELFSGECWFRGPRPSKERRVPLLRWIESLRGQIHEKTWPEVAGLSRLAAYRQSMAFDPLATATPFSAWEAKGDSVTRDLCLGMTRLQPSERWRAQDVLAHPLLSSAASGSSPERAAPGGGAPKPAAQGPGGRAAPGGSAPKPAAQGPKVPPPTAKAEGQKEEANPCQSLAVGALAVEPPAVRAPRLPGRRRRVKTVDSALHQNAAARPIEAGERSEAEAEKQEADDENDDGGGGGGGGRGGGGGGGAGGSAAPPRPGAGERSEPKAARQNTAAHRRAEAEEPGCSSTSPAAPGSGAPKPAAPGSGSPEPAEPGGCTCTCKGWCHKYSSSHHSWSKANRGQCSNARVPGRKGCAACSCAHPGCANLNRRASPYCQLHLDGELCDELRAVAKYRTTLAKLDPIDVQAYLEHARKIRSVLLRAILADVWEPRAVQELARIFVAWEANKLPLNGDMLRDAVLQVLRAMTDEELIDCDSLDAVQSHRDVLKVGGSCRHFGVLVFAQHLKIVQDATKPIARERNPLEEGQARKRRRVGDSGAAAPKRRAQAGGHPSGDADSCGEDLCIQGRTFRVLHDTSLCAELVDAGRASEGAVAKQVRKGISAGDPVQVTLAFQDFVFSEKIPLRLKWGRQTEAYHGRNIVRKLWLQVYHANEDAFKINSLDEIRSFGPDVCDYLSCFSRLWSGCRVRKSFAPVSPTRLSMWACLVGIAFKKSEAVRQAVERDLISASLFEECSAQLVREKGHSPHIWDVFLRAMATLEDVGRDQGAGG